MLKKIVVLAVLFGFIGTAPVEKPFKIQILHTNDMHSRFEETSPTSGVCKESNKNKTCIGGFGRLIYFVKRAREAAINQKVLFLNAGDTYTGTVWFGVHRWKIVSDFMNLLQPDAMSFGTHEFDDGIAGIFPFINASNFPIVASNLDFSDEPLLKQTNVSKSIIYNINNVKIAIIGYLTPTTAQLSSPGEVIFENELTAIRKEAERLDKLGVKILIALGHSGFEMDKMIARKIPLIDVVVGGMSNTFLWNGKEHNGLKADEEYPYVVLRPNGRHAPVVQAYAYTRYIGQLNLTFDGKGDLRFIAGRSIFMDSSIPQDPEALQLLEKYRPQVDSLSSQIVGKSKVLLDGESKHCRFKECNFGNLYTDALISYRSSQYEGKYWTDCPIGITNGGSIRNSIIPNHGGNISRAELVNCIAYSNPIVYFKLTGSDLLKTVETSVYTTGKSKRGQFLQVSGLQIIYDLNKKSGSRVTSMLVRCSECSVPQYEPLNRTARYGVLTNAFIANGGDGYDIMKDKAIDKKQIDLDDLEVVAWYIQHKSPILPEVQGRIKMISHLPWSLRKSAGNVVGLNISLRLPLLLVLLSAF